MACVAHTGLAATDARQIFGSSFSSLALSADTACLRSGLLRVTAVSSVTLSHLSSKSCRQPCTAYAAASGSFGDLLSDRPWDIDLTPFVTQQLQPAQIAEKHERRCFHDPYAHEVSLTASQNSASICSSSKLMAQKPYSPSLLGEGTRPVLP